MIAAVGIAWVVVVAAGGVLFRPHHARDASRRRDGAGAVERLAVRHAPYLLGVFGLAATAVRWTWSGTVLAIAALGVAVVARHRERQNRQDALMRELPEIIELLRVCAEGGLNVRLALETVAAIARGEVSVAFTAAARAASAGASLADALEEHAEHLGPAARPLVTALAASERYGVALVPALDRLGAEARTDERRRGEAHARKVPVRLLFPLVLCILPAFALLTVAPLIAGGLESLRLP